MREWAVALGGEEYDIEDARQLFGYPNAKPVRIGVIQRPDGVQHTALFADEFEGVESAAY